MRENDANRAGSSVDMKRGDIERYESGIDRRSGFVLGKRNGDRGQLMPEEKQKRRSSREKGSE